MKHGSVTDWAYRRIDSVDFRCLGHAAIFGGVNMSYDYAANGWTQHESGLWFKNFGGFWTGFRGDYIFIRLSGSTSIPQWAISAWSVDSPEKLDAAWSAELKRRESLPLLDPSLWQGGDDRGYWYHPAEGGYRIHLDSHGWWDTYKCPSQSFNTASDVNLAKKICENFARRRKGLPPL